MKPFERQVIIAGKSVFAGLKDWGFFYLDLNPENPEEGFGIIINSPEDRVALGRLLVELGSKLATPAPKKDDKLQKVLKDVDKEFERLDGYIAGVTVSQRVWDRVRSLMR